MNCNEVTARERFYSVAPCDQPIVESAGHDATVTSFRRDGFDDELDITLDSNIRERGK